MTADHVMTTAEEITAQNVEAVIRLDQQVKQHRSRMMCAVDKITSFSGSMPFVWFHLIWFGAWIGYDHLFPSLPNFDPYPYQLLTLIVSLEAILLSTFILISQNRDARLAEKRNHLILQIALLSEQENTKVLKMLEAISKKFSIKIEGDPTIQALSEATSTDSLSAQIDRGMERLEGKKVD